MGKKSEMRRSAEAFVEKALEDSQGKRPTKKAVSQAVDRIVENFAPIMERKRSDRRKGATATAP